MDEELRQAFERVHTHLDRLSGKLTEVNDRTTALEEWKTDREQWWTEDELRQIRVAIRSLNDQLAALPKTIQETMRESFGELAKEQHIFYLKAFGRKSWAVIMFLGMGAIGAAVSEIVKGLL